MTIKTQIATIYIDPEPHFEKSELCLEMFLRIQAPYILLHTSEDKFRANVLLATMWITSQIRVSHSFPFNEL